MARTLMAFLNRKGVPEKEPLQKAIDALKLPLKLDDAYAPFETTGYVPCTLDGEDAGFDLRFSDAAADLTSALNLGDRDTVLSLKWSGDSREEAAARIFCAALVQNFNAVVLADKADERLPAEQLVSMARNLLVE